MAGHPYVILAAVDTSDFADLVLEHAIELAAARDDADLHVLGVLEVGHRPRAWDHRHDGALEELEKRLRGQVEEALERFGTTTRGCLRIRVHARLGIPHEQILELAAECRTGLIVLGRHGAGYAGRRRAGSVPARVLGDARCPVLVLSPLDYGDPAGEEEPTCAACSAARRDSSGERWFCDHHATGYTWRSSRMIAQPLLRDQGIWF